MSTLALVVVCAVPVFVAFIIARRSVRWHLVVVLLLCGALEASATSADRLLDQGKQHLNQWVTSQYAEAHR